MSHPRAWIGAVVGTAVTAALLVPVGPADAAPTARSVVGAQTAGDSLFPHQGNGGYDVAHYDLDLAWATSKVITATATITATTTASQPLSKFSLDLEGLTVRSVAVDGEAATYSRIASGAKHKLVITPSTPVDGRFTTRVTYAGTPRVHTDPDGSEEGWISTGSGQASGIVALNEPVGSMTWFPNNNTPKDKATYSTSVTVPYDAALGSRNRSVVANGLLTRTTKTSTTRTFTWDQPEQQATYLALVGIGAYTVKESDVALTGGRTTHEWSYADPTASGINGFATARAQLPRTLRAIEQRYGPYPGSSTGLVLDVSSLDYALETQDRPYFENSIDSPTLVHELAHQWFGNAVSPADWGDVWLNEGPATFLETQIAADLDRSDSTQDVYYETWRDSTTASLWSVPSAGFDDPSILFDTQVYTRGAVALEALRSGLGDDVFTDVMRTWLTTYGGRSATTAQFIALAERVSGRDLGAFFQTWVYGTTKPAAWPVAYELTLASSPATGSTVEPGAAVSYTLTATNSGKVPTGASTVEVDAAALLARGTLGPLPTGVTRSGTTLVWAVPSRAVGASATVTVTATLDSGRGGAFAVTARGRTLGADCGTGCRSTLTLPQGVLTSADPVVEGTAKVGRSVTASTPGWTAGTTFTYEWLRNGTAIPGATSSTYEAVAADVDTDLSVRVVGSAEGYDRAARTSAVVRVVPGTLSPTPTPAVSGEPRVGTTVTATHEPWGDDVALTYQWTIDGAPISGATESSYTLVGSQADRQLRVALTGTQAGYTTVTRTSAAVTVVPADYPVSPTPTLSRTPRVGEAVAAVTGTWTRDATLTYQWSVAGRAVSGATSSTYTPRPADVGAELTVTVKGRRTGYPDVSRTSEPVTVLRGVQSPAPVPTITGTARAGNRLTGVVGTWHPDTTLTYAWAIDGTAVPGATSTTFTVRTSDIGKLVTFAVSGARPGYEPATRTSERLRVRTSLQTLQPRPTVKGNPRVGNTLRAYAGAHDPGVTITYQWYVGSSAVARATAATFRLRSQDRGKLVRVQTRAKKTGYATVIKDSASLRVR